MKVLAIAKKGAEYLYNPYTAHKVSERSAERIREALNDAEYMLHKHPGGTWNIYDVGEIDTAAQVAEYQRFTIRNGAITRRGDYYV